VILLLSTIDTCLKGSLPTDHFIVFYFFSPMKLNLILAIALGGMILKIVMFILLCFGSLLWPLSIVAVIWGVYDGLLPAIQKKEFARAAVILLILLVTCLIIVISLQEAVYLTAFIVPILLVYIYINSYFTSGEEIFTDFSNN